MPAKTTRLLFLVLALTFGVYAACLGNGFTYDDRDVVRVPSAGTGVANEHVAELQSLGTYLTSSYSESHHGRGRGFRPITVLSFALVHRLSAFEEPRADGLRAPAWLQHLVNVLLHCFATYLTFALLAQFVGRGLPALLGAAVFGLHALRSDPVISLVGRAEIMGYAFGAGGLLLYLTALRRTGRARLPWLAATALALFLAFGSKESAAAWAVLCPFSVWLLRTKDPSLPTLRGQWLPGLFAIGLPLAVFVFLWLPIFLTTGEFAPAYQSNPLWYFDALPRVVNGVILLGYGLFKVVAPLHLACDYGEVVFDLATGLGDWRFWLVLVVLVTVLALCLRHAQRRPPLAMAAAMFFGFSFVVSNIPLPIETVFGERLYYTPAVALSFLVAAISVGISAKLAARAPGASSAVRFGCGVLLAIWLAVGGVRIVSRCFDWRDNVTLFAVDSINQPRSIQLLTARAGYLRNGDPAVWKAQIEAARRLDETSPRPLLELVEFYSRQADAASDRMAEASARAGLASTHRDAREHVGDFRFALAKSLAALERYPEAEAEFALAIEFAERDPIYIDPRPRMTLGEYYQQQGRLEAAAAQWAEVCRRVPKFLDAWDARLRLAQGRADDEAVQSLIRAANQHCPNSAVLLVHQAISVRRDGDLPRALLMLRRSVPLLSRESKHAEHWLEFASALGESGQIDEACEVVAEWIDRPLVARVRQGFSIIARRLGMR